MTKQILVVDDSSMMRKMLTRALTMEGVDAADITEAVDGLDALEKLEAGLPSLLITDVTMPRLDGRGLLAEVQERGWTEQLDIAVCTSVSTTRILLDLVRLGADVVIRKPFSPGDISSQLGRFLAPHPEAVEELLSEPVEGPADVSVGATEEAVPSLDLWGGALDTAVATVLEQMAFIDAVPIDALVESSRVMFSSTVPLTGPEPGDLWLFGPADLCALLAESFMGSHPGIDDVSRLDALSELLNVIAGEFLEVRKRAGDPVASELVLGTPTASVFTPGAIDLATRAYRFDDSEHVLHAVWDCRPLSIRRESPLTSDLRGIHR